MGARIIWWYLKLFNDNNNFRRHIHQLSYLGEFYVKHHGYFELCQFVSIGVDDDECVVLRVLSNVTEKVKRNNLYLNA